MGFECSYDRVWLMNVQPTKNRDYIFSADIAMYHLLSILQEIAQREAL